jgi:hypothetical protein
MALIVPDLGLLFIMAPHTGCTAIGEVLRERFDAAFVPPEDILRPDGTIEVPRKHSRLPQLMEAGLITPEQRARLVVAAGVRNPFDEEVSHFKQREREFRARRDDAAVRARLVGGKPPAELEEIDFETWLRRRYVGRPWSKALGRTPKRPSDFTEGADMIIRFERLQADVDMLMRQLGVPERVEIPVVNPTGVRAKRPYQEFYTPRARAIVEGVFADRLARYGYTWQPAPPAAAAAPAAAGTPG